MGDESGPVERFQTYLRIKTVHPEPDYEGAVKFLRAQAEEIGLPCRVLEPVKGKPVVIMTWAGTEPSLPTVLLNSHTDVVPVFPDHWEHDPFGAVKTAAGDIFARGTQDMKCVTMQYLEAVRELKARGVQPVRTVHLSFVPDEEIGGVTGMKAFVETDDWQRLNVACALDEGLANPSEEMTVFYGERHTWKVEVTCCGRSGHGSRFLPDTAGEKLSRVLQSFLDYRRQQEQLLADHPDWKLGDVTTCNLTIINGGIQRNVVPDKFHACFDCRVAQRTPPDEFEALVRDWCRQAGPDVTYILSQKEDNLENSPISPDNPWWSAFSAALARLGVSTCPEIFPAGTDSRFIRRLGIPCYGFSPMNRTPILLHDHNEFINETVFLEGIKVYAELIPSLARVPA
ncbi:aminoacylase-1B-like [Pollicipes pollicipes]|uniref:aminoacylase-1B-like n=1 Tax=Pollicipes pollicipes TaxID=41117 RepID=UPI00188515EB|nr:aminoacylase-1B-like [Pollicipes pollicipes]XP_037069279.1 aminoacylase-1B-like [Pollicipes pollicipes]